MTDLAPGTINLVHN